MNCLIVTSELILSLIGVLLLDPTIQKGTPLWYGYRNWEPTPSMNSPSIPAAPPRKSLFEDFVHWAKKAPASQFTNLSSSTNTTKTDMPLQTLLYLICAEWLAISDYIRTRIGIIEWEISNPEQRLRHLRRTKKTTRVASSRPSLPRNAY